MLLLSCKYAYEGRKHKDFDPDVLQTSTSYHPHCTFSNTLRLNMMGKHILTATMLMLIFSFVVTSGAALLSVSF